MKQDNTHRSLSQIAVVTAWFEPVPERERQFSLHANVAFHQKRLGGGPHSNVYFTLAIRKCQVAVVLPERGKKFWVDPQSLMLSPPKKPRIVERENMTTADATAGITLGPRALGGEGRASWSRVSKEKEVLATEHLQSLQSTTREGYPSWAIKGDSEDRYLEGSLWDPRIDSLLVLADERDVGRIERDRILGMLPDVYIQVRCLREDLIITDIRHKSPSTMERISARRGMAARSRTAEAFIKAELMKESLLVGDLSDLYSELHVAEKAVPVYERHIHHGGEDSNG